MSQNPDVMAKAIKEIEEVMGDRTSPTYEDVSKFKYLDACFKEALRLNPPVQQLKRECAQDTIVLGNKLLRKGQRIEVLTSGLHRDPNQWDQGVFGDVDKFNPDRHLPGAPPRHPNAMAPFGFGVRGCIGMQFALLEARTFLCMIFNYFTNDTPKGFQIQSHLGHGAAPTCLNLSFNLKYREGGPLANANPIEMSLAQAGIEAPTNKAVGDDADKQACPFLADSKEVTQDADKDADKPVCPFHKLIA